MTCKDIIELYQQQKPLVEIYHAYREVDITERDEKNQGYTPLHVACHFADSRAISILLEKGADVNVKDNEGYSPLCILGMSEMDTVDEDHVREAATMLLAAGAKVPRSGKNTTALIQAVRHRHFLMAEAIVDTGEKINSSDSNGENVLHMASHVTGLVVQDKERSKRRLEEMKSEGWHPEKKMQEAEMEVIKYQTQEEEIIQLVKKLLANGTIDPEEKSGVGKTPFEIALEEKGFCIGALLSGKDGEMDELSLRTCGMDIFQALFYKNENALDAILCTGIDLQSVCEHERMYDFLGKSPLACALVWSEFQAAEMILNAGADPNWLMPDENSAFAAWIKHNRFTGTDEQYIHLLEHMLQNGWDINLPTDKRGNTALAFACLHAGHGPCNPAIRFFLKNGADPNAVNPCGQTPLMLLCGGDYWDGYIPRLPVLPRSYPYGHKYFGQNEMDVFETLLEAGADTNFKDQWGNTLLHYLAASCKGNELRQVAEILEDFNIPNTEAVNNEGLTAMDVAISRNNDDMVKFLLKNA